MITPISVAPVITTAPPAVVKVTKAHDKVTLQCAARGSPVPSLEWSKDGMVVSTNRTTKTADEVKGELIIPSFSSSDQGVYKCFFRNYENGTAEIATTAGTQVTKYILLKVLKTNNAHEQLLITKRFFILFLEAASPLISGRGTWTRGSNT